MHMQARIKYLIAVLHMRCYALLLSQMQVNHARKRSFPRNCSSCAGAILTKAPPRPPPRVIHMRLAQ